jgi:hypothetical protein
MYAVAPGHAIRQAAEVMDVGGLKKFKDLLEAISGTETDAIPF